MLRITVILLLILTGQTVFTQSLPPLLDAIHKNDIAEVKSLIAKGAAITIKNEDGDNVLMYASLYSTAECMQLLLEKGARVNEQNKLGETALMWSANDLAKTTLLLKHNADIKAKSLFGNTALLVACVGASQGDIIKLLLSKGADALAKNKDSATSLMRVALYGDTAIARILLDKGVNINARNDVAETALMYAVRSVNKEMIEWLLLNGADINIKDAYKAIPLAYAPVANEPEIIKLLLKYTKDINQQDIDGMTLLMWATYNEIDNPEIIKLLLDAGADVTLKDKKGATALTWALKKGNTQTVALLKKAGAK